MEHVYHTCPSFWGPAGEPGKWLADLLSELSALRHDANPTPGGWLAGAIANPSDYQAIVDLRSLVYTAWSRSRPRSAVPWPGVQGPGSGAAAASAARKLAAGIELDRDSNAAHSALGPGWLVQAPASTAVRGAAYDLLRHLDDAVVAGAEAPHEPTGDSCLAVELLEQLAPPPGSHEWPTSRGPVSVAWRDRTTPNDFESVLERLPIRPVTGPAQPRGALPPLRFETNDEVDLAADDNRDIAAGYTYLGQFIVHDLTFSARVRLRGHASTWVSNLRTPSLDLDSIYGLGPDVAPYLYDNPSPSASAPRCPVGVLRYHSSQLHLGLPDEPLRRQLDLPRTDQYVALIGDPRNDENVVLSQLHLVFVRLHNAVLEAITPEYQDDRERFLAARDIVVRAYRDVVFHDYLARIVGTTQFDDLQAGRLGSGDYRRELRRRYTEGRFLPSEFVFGAMRFGHAMVRSTYHLNDLIQRVPLLALSGNNADPFQLLGFRGLPRHWTIDWSFFFDAPGRGSPQPSRLIDTKFTPVLMRLPPPVSLAGKTLLELDLDRAQQMGVMSGWQAADRLGVPRAVGADAPLPHYVVAEAEVAAGGRHLGPVGAILVGDVLSAILDADRHFDGAAYSPPMRLRARGGTNAPPSMADLIVYAATDACTDPDPGASPDAHARARADARDALAMLRPTR